MAFPVRALACTALKGDNVTKDEIKSVREWLNSWGEGPNWTDESGLSVPIQKVTLRKLLDEVESQRVLDLTLGDWKRAMCLQVYDALARRDEAEVECKRLRDLLGDR